MDDVSEMDDIPTNFTSTKDNSRFKYIELITKLSGYANSHYCLEQLCFFISY